MGFLLYARTAPTVTKMGAQGWRFAAFVPFLAALWACSAWTPQPAQTGFTTEQASEVFAAGYDSISEYYIDRIEMPPLALHGMEGLHKLHPHLTVVSAQRNLTLPVAPAH